MNREQAMKYDASLIEQLQTLASECGMQGSAGKYIVDRFVEFIPEDNVKGMIFLNNAPASYKAGNVRLDLKKAMMAGLEFTASVNMPDNFFNYIQLLIVSALFIENATKQELSELESYMVYLLHEKDAYHCSVDEEEFVLEMQEWYLQRKGKELERGKIIETINRLHKMKIIDFEDGNVYLKETVWGELE